MNALMQSFEAADSWQVFFVQYTSIATLLRMMLMSTKGKCIDEQVDQQNDEQWAAEFQQSWSVLSRVDMQRW